MRRDIATALLVLPIGMITLLPNSAQAGERTHSAGVNRPVVTVEWNNNRQYDDRWNNNRYLNDRWNNNRRYDDRWDNNRRNENRWDNNRRFDNWRNDRYYQQYGNRRVWIPGHWEPGLLGIGRRWVEGHWEYRP